MRSSSIQTSAASLEMTESTASSKSFSLTNIWRFCYWLGVAALFAWAAWQRFVLPLDPIADPDTWGYLSPALRKLLGAEFGHTYGRNCVYPAFVFSLLRAFGDFRAIVIAQHLLGLVAGATLLLSWRRSRALVSDSRLGRGGHDGLGLLLTATFLVAGEPIRFEMQLRPEGVAAFLISVTLYFALQFIVSCFLEKRPGATVGYGIGACFTSILLASAKPSFGLVAVVTLLMVSILFLRRGWFPQKAVLATGVIVSSASLLGPEHLLSRHDEASRTFLPTQLFVIHADLIDAQIAEDLERRAETPYPHELLESIHNRLRTEIVSSMETGGIYFRFPSLGFCPDYLMYDPRSINTQLRQEFGDITSLCLFYRYYYLRIWRERPLAVVKKIARQMALFYSRRCPAYVRHKFLNLADGYRNGVTSLGLQSYRDLWMAYPPGVQFMGRTESLAQSAPSIQQPLLLRVALSCLARLYRPLLVATIVLGPAFLFRKSYRTRLGWLAAWVAFLFLWNWACCLEVAIIHSLDVRRYSSVQVFFTSLAQFSAIWFFCEIALEIRAATRSRVMAIE
jgi:hypothetical protein